MENLIDVLEGENGQYQKLLGLAESKTPVIVSGDVDRLGEITEEEQEIVGKIQNWRSKGINFWLTLPT